MIKATTILLLLITSISSIPTFADNTNKQSVDIKITSLDQLIALFKKHHYTITDWQEGVREVPRITFDGVGDKWHKNADHIPVQEKKQVFFRLMAPLVLLANENILAERSTIKSAELSSSELLTLAIKYGVIDETEQLTSLTSQQRQQLLQQVDIIPPSLAMAQAANESAWATSRFTEEGNSFFGQWDFSGKGMKPKHQRKSLGNYGLARFDNPLDAVEGYMFNINTTGAYHGFRVLRENLRQQNKPITGLVLAGTLTKYSERGQAYVDDIRSMITYNKLATFNDAYLSDTVLINLIIPKESNAM
ncbi:glucosaminidase domain-containing protein [Colwellia echini]|uniref:Glucosaminidase n=1 Tax=Colwellia echini TaxID=1982103 RepID=A0ABY3MWE3_9GAMM|nr:glucosaminidase domain-containing protein [Colwellia echini]TYK65362.1 glucosaminidase [Colwellia echini]